MCVWPPCRASCSNVPGWHIRCDDDVVGTELRVLKGIRRVGEEKRYVSYEMGILEGRGIGEGRREGDMATPFPQRLVGRPYLADVFEKTQPLGDSALCGGPVGDRSGVWGVTASQPLCWGEVNAASPVDAPPQAETSPERRRNETILPRCIAAVKPY